MHARTEAHNEGGTHRPRTHWPQHQPAGLWPFELKETLLFEYFKSAWYNLFFLLPLCFSPFFTFLPFELQLTYKYTDK